MPSFSVSPAVSKTDGLSFGRRVWLSRLVDRDGAGVYTDRWVRKWAMLSFHM